MFVACLDGNIDATDLAPMASGLQIDCHVSDRPPNGNGGSDIPIPRCALEADGVTPVPYDGENRPCWYVEPDALSCASTPTQLALVVERASKPLDGTEIFARCLSH